MATKTTLDKTVTVGVFQNRPDAQACVNDLKRSGFRDDEIGMITRDPGTGDGTSATADSKAGEGAAVGVAAGAGIGALWAIGIAAGLLPAIGPVIAGGIFASILASAAGGAAVGGLVGALVGLGIPEEEAEFYESEVKAGRTIVSVKSGDREELAREIIARHHGFEGRDSMPSHATSAASARGAIPTHRFSNPPKMPESKTMREGQACDMPRGSVSETTVDLKKEDLHVRKENETVGEVRIRKDVVTEHKTLDVPVTHEEVVIERRAATAGESTSADIRPGEEIRIPVKEEHVHLEKSGHVAEHVKVGKRQVQKTEHVSGDVRHEELRVEKDGECPVKPSDLPSKHPK